MAEPTGLRIACLTGPAIGPILSPLAALRIAVFRDFPYLYDGDAAYETWYLERFAAAPDALVVAAFASGDTDGERLVGAATAAPLRHEHAEFQEPFAARGIDPATVFYLAESVLQSEWRGLGIGHRFFDEREAMARRLGFTKTAFCAVLRPVDHPARPEGYRPLDAFWKKRGYQPLAGMTTTFPWKDIDERHETRKTMQFWLRDIADG